jgi:acyl-CoA reductase-like NAD-dependent aldehyde dehydrogenase
MNKASLEARKSDSVSTCDGIELPFGSFGRSGHGREKGFAAPDHFSTPKTIILNHG